MIDEADQLGDELGHQLILCLSSSSARKRSIVSFCGPSWPIGPPQDPAGEIGGQSADVAAQLADGPHPLGLELLRAAAVDLGDLAVGLGAHVVADALGVGPGLVT